MGDWGGLIADILFMIAEGIEVVEDFVSFSSVCTTWRAASLRKGASRSLQPVQSLMLRSHLSTNEIYNFARNKICKSSLPKDTIMQQKFDTNGWILTCGDVVMDLINPFSGHVISLPPKPTLSNQIYYEIRNPVLSSNPSFFPDNYTLMVILVHFCKYRLGFWKPGDREWTVLQTDINYCEFEDIIYCKGQFYTVDQFGVIYVCDVRGSNPTMVAVSSPPLRNFPIPTIRLVAKTDNYSLLLIIDWHCGNPRYEVYELDLIGKEGLKEVNDLGTKTIFVSYYHESVCLEHSKFPPGIIKTDDIDFNDHCLYWVCRNRFLVTSEHLHRSGMSMRIYNLKGKEVQDFVHPLESSSL